MKLKDKVAIVTGGGRGIGKAISLSFAAEGAKVVIFEYDEEPGKEAVGEIQDAGGEAISITGDVTDTDSVGNLVGTALYTFGRIDILVNNAGVIMPAMLHKMTMEQFDRVMDVHVRGAFMCVQAVSRHMMEQKYGKIINVTSSAGLVGTIGQINYSSAKGAVTSLTKSAAKELARYNITVNCIAPSAATRMTEKIMNDEKFKQMYLERVPMRRWAEPDEIAPAFVFLASDDSSYITGQILCVDGGMVM
jgi:3-oxoacyl-[acyl-carrier protein] reductase